MAIGDIINTTTLSLTFDSDFSDFISSPDGSTGLWRTSMMNGNRTLGSNGEEEYYSDSSVGTDPFSIINGSTLQISATPASVTGSNSLGLPYNSGVITTEGSFNQLYGYFEIDAKLPAGQGLWPAFWLLPADGGWPPELDAFEVLGNNPSTLYFSTHSGDQPTQGTTVNTVDTSASYNLYGVMWGPQTVSLYINNVEVATMPTPADMNVPMYILANLAVGGYWPGDPNSTTQFPANMDIAYIKAFAYPGTTGGTVYDTLPSQNIGTAATTPTITGPSGFYAVTGQAATMGGVQVAANWPGGDFTIMVSASHGTFTTTATSDVFTSGEGTSYLTLTGNLAPINAALESLQYTATSTGQDWIWVGATDPQGQQGTASIVATDVTTLPAGTSAGSPVISLPSSGTSGSDTTGSTSSGTAPVVTTPGTLSITAGATQALAGLSVADPSQSGTFTVTLGDTTGVLTTTAVSGVTATGEGTTALTMTGTLSAINSELASLTYKAAASAGSDYLWVSADDANGNQGLNEVVVTAVSAPAAALSVSVPASVTVNAGTSAAVSGISVADTSAAGAVTVEVTDATGLLSTTAINGVTVIGEGTPGLTLSGSLAAVNTALATMTYQATVSGGSDTISVAASDSNGNSDPSIAVTVAAAPTVPVVTAPSTLSLTANTSAALAGVSVADGSASGTFVIRVSDSTGDLTTTAVSGVTASGEGTASLTLTGTLSAINTELATLSYKAGASANSDWLWVSANDPSGNQGLNHVVVTASAAAAVPAPVVTVPTTLALAAGTSQAVPGVTVSDSNATGAVTVTVTDTTGLLSTTAITGVTATGEGTTALALSGSLSAINSELATLTYKAAASAGSDAISVNATDANGDSDPDVAVTITAPVVAPPVLTAPATLSLPAGSTGALPGVSFTDQSATGTFSSTVSDSYGVLNTTAINGVTATGEGTTSLTLTGSLAAINAELATLTYKASSSVGTDWLWVSANDPSGNQSLGHVVVSATTPATPPSVTAPNTTTLTAGTSKALSGISVTDGSATGAFMVKVSDGTGLLNATSTSGVTTQGGGTSSLTLSGSLAAINTELATLTYQAAAAAGSDQITVSATDVYGNAGTAQETVSVAAPPIIAMPASFAVAESATKAATGLSVSDGLTGGTFTVKVSDKTGALATTAVSGVTATGEGTTSLTLSGSLAAINSELATLTYRAAASAGADSLSVALTDPSGNQASGQNSITVTAPPVVTVPSILTIAAGATKALTGITVTDGAVSGSVTVTLDDSLGLLQTTAVSGVTTTGEGTTALSLTGALAAINSELATLTYQASNAAGTDAISVDATDSNGGTDPSVAVTVTALPLVTTPATLSIPASGTVAVGGVSVADSVGGVFTIRVSDSTGLLSTATVNGVTAAGEGTNALTLTGSLAAVNSALASLNDAMGTGASSDWLWVSANDASGNQGLGHVVVTTPALPSAVENGLLGGAQQIVLTGTTGIGAALQVDNGRVLENTGTLEWNGGTILLGGYDPATQNHTGTLDNASGATFILDGDGKVNSAWGLGSGSIVNAGTLVKQGGLGDTTVYAAVTNTGTIEVGAGTLTLEQNVTGNGTFQLQNMSEAEFASAVTGGGTMQFLSPNATLKVDTTGAFGDTILGFAQGNTIDAASISPGASTIVNYSSIGTGGTLSISDGVHTALFAMTGSYNTQNFVLSSDNHGGTAITFR